jgi:hypothetical protein
VADAPEPRRLAVDQGQEEDAVRGNEVGRRAGGDLLVEVDPGVLAVVDQRPVRLADELGVERLHPRIVAIDRLQGESHRDDANGLKNRSILRAMRMVTPDRISSVTGKELSAVLAECAARTEVARAGVEEARKGVEEARRGIEEARKKQEEATARLETQWAEADARWQEERIELRVERKERSLENKAIIAELKEHRDERRALLEAIFRVIDRLDRQQPPPPNLRSV